MTQPILNEIDIKSVFTKLNLPVCEYFVNPYAGCIRACKYCYVSFMKRFTGYGRLGTFLDIKNGKEIKNPEKYKGLFCKPFEWRCLCPFVRRRKQGFLNDCIQVYKR